MKHSFVLDHFLPDGEILDLGYGIKIKSIFEKIDAYTDDRCAVSVLFKDRVVTFDKTLYNNSNCVMIKTSSGKYAYFDMDQAFKTLFIGKGPIWEVKIETIECVLAEVSEFLKYDYYYLKPKLAVITPHGDPIIPDLYDDLEEDDDDLFIERNDRESSICDLHNMGIRYIMRNIGAIVNGYYKDQPDKKISRHVIESMRENASYDSDNVVEVNFQSF